MGLNSWCKISNIEKLIENSYFSINEPQKQSSHTDIWLPFSETGL